MFIKKANISDIVRIREIYDIAKQYMDNTGNPNQWKKGYPSEEILYNDIEKEQLYVCVENSIVCGVFMFAITDDVTYHIITDGEWKNDEPYAVIHRIASDGTVKGLFSQVVTFCRKQIKEQNIRNLKIDTYKDNLTMQHVVEKNGFEKCGTIYLKDGSPRIAYQLTDI